MLNKVGIGLVIAIALFVGYLVLRAYKPCWFSAVEGFVTGNTATPAAARREPFTDSQAKKAVPVVSDLQPAPPTLADKPAGPPRVVAPGGPSAPNARPPPMVPRISPDASPLDPYDSTNMQAPIEDTMRYPERSFGPGTVNDGTNISVGSGVASSVANSAVSSFSPEFAQNGGSFMDSVFANDLTQGDEYATA